MSDETPEPTPETTRRPRREAVALSYDQGNDAAPRVVAAGKGVIADAILARAQDASVPVQEDAVLTQALGKLEVGREIPPEFYRAVAELLAFVFKLEGRFRS